MTQEAHNLFIMSGCTCTCTCDCRGPASEAVGEINDVTEIEGCGCNDSAATGGEDGTDEGVENTDLSQESLSDDMMEFYKDLFRDDEEETIDVNDTSS